MNLLHDPWIAVRRRSGARLRIAPWQLTDAMADDPIVGLASCRADFDGSLAQLLVGLLQASRTPANDRVWWRALDEPPSPRELREAFEPFHDAFELLGDGPRFLQDLTLSEDEAKLFPVEKIFIDAGLHVGRDHFRKGGQVGALCLPCVAAALTTLQLTAPVGGRGHRASPRGGGPVTTLVRREDSLWATLWANVLERADLADLGNRDRDRPEDRFPWLAPTRLSDKSGKDTTAEDVHPLQLFWPMPRRIRLLPKAAVPETTCDLCGEVTETIVDEYLTRHHGVNYTGPWAHPFTPQRKGKDGTPLPVQMEARGVSYRHWLGLVQNDPDLGRQPARVVGALNNRVRGVARGEWQLWAFGYDMDNMKARGWYEGMMRLVLPDPDLLDAFQAECQCLVRAARWADGALQGAARQAVVKREKDFKGDLTAVESRFWQSTEAEFYRHVDEVPTVLDTADEDAHLDTIKRSWHRTLLRRANEIFEDWSGAGLFQAVDPAQVARARNRLHKNLWGKKMKGLLGLDDLGSTATATSETATED